MNECEALEAAAAAVKEDNSEANQARLVKAFSAWLGSEQCKAEHEQWLRDCGITHASQA